MKPPRILALLGDNNGCSWWRISRPLEALARQGHLSAYADKDDSRLADFVHLWDAVVLPRLSWKLEDRAFAHRWANALHNAGLAIIGEFDDDLVSPSINLRLKQTTLPDERPEDLEQRRLDRLDALRLCDGLVVSSRRLATIMRGVFDGPVIVVPNAIDAAYWKACLKGSPRLIPGLTIGWAGGSRPEHDLDEVAVAWGRIAERYPEVTFVVYGYQPTIIDDHVPQERIRRIPWHPLEVYPKPYRNIDIGCAAVSDTPFNRAKTPIKVWEYTLGGAAVVGTPTLYREAISDGEDGLLAESADEWECALSTLIEEPSLRKRLRLEQRRRIMREHDLERECWRWPAAWASIIEDFRLKRARRMLMASA